MNPLFVQALERLGASGAAIADWKQLIGDPSNACFTCLVPTGLLANVILDPQGSGRRLRIEPDGSDGFVGIDEDNSNTPPLPVEASELKMFRPDERVIGRWLADHLGFAYGDWESKPGPMRRVGSLQSTSGHTTAVWLFLPTGTLGDYAAFLRYLTELANATLLVPSARWITAEASAVANRHGISLRVFDLDKSPRWLDAKPISHEKSAAHAVIRPVTGLNWSDVEIIVGRNRTIQVKAPHQQGEYRFPANTKLSPEHPIGMLMTVAHKGEWKNPPKESADYERISRSFRRLQQLLMTLIPVPGKPFHLSQSAFVPKFTSRIETRSQVQ